jgi:uncharacterized repeat protein (TIGR02059 family)
MSFFIAPIAANAAGPNLISATVEASAGRTINLIFDDLGTSLTQLNTADFSVTGSAQGPITVSSVGKTTRNIQVSLSTMVAGGQTVSLTYTPSTNVPTNSANEPLAGFTTPVAHPAGSAVPQIGAEETFVSWTNNKSQIRSYFYVNSGRLVCALTKTNFQVKVNGTVRSISSISGGDCTGNFVVTLSSPLVENDVVTLSYIPSPGSLETAFGTPGAAFTDLKVYGVPDTIAPAITLPSVSNHTFGQGGEVALVANESVIWQVSTDRTLSFQIFGTPQKLLVSSILPAGNYTVGLTATDEAGNSTTRSIAVNILEAGATPSPTPTVTSTPLPISNNATLFKSCSLMNKKYSGGVASSYSSKNKGAGMYYIPRVDATLYKANIKLDKDKDGIACER